MGVTIRVGQDTSHLDMRVTRGAYPQFARLHVAWIDYHGFSGQFETDGVASAFSGLATDLRELYRHLDASSSWSSLEHNVRLEFVGDGRGHFDVTVELIPDHLLGPWVKSTSRIDQSQLPEIIAAAEEAAGV